MNGLAPFDIFVIALLGVMTFWGGFRGAVSQFASILSLIVSWFVASRCYGIITPYVPLSDPWKEAVAIFILFLGITLMIRLVAKAIRGAVRQTPLKEFDRQIGALFGLAKGVLICLVVAFFAVIIGNQPRQWVIGSQSGRILVRMISTIQKYVPENENHAKIRETFEQFAKSAAGEGVDTEPITLSEEVDQVKTKLQSIVNQKISGQLTSSWGNSSKNADSSSTSSSADSSTAATSAGLADFQRAAGEFFDGVRDNFESNFARNASQSISSSSSSDSAGEMKGGAITGSVFSSDAYLAAVPVESEEESTNASERLTPLSAAGDNRDSSNRSIQQTSGETLFNRFTFAPADTAPSL